MFLARDIYIYIRQKSQYQQASDIKLKKKKIGRNEKMMMGRKLLCWLSCVWSHQ